MRYIVTVKRVEEEPAKQSFLTAIALMLALMMRVTFFAVIGILILIIASAG